MTDALVPLLIVNGIFNLVVWPLFFRRVARDPRARTAAGRHSSFFTVHAVIVTIALVLAVASIAAAVLALIRL